jgi:uncharacterized membrane protein YGL010W
VPQFGIVGSIISSGLSIGITGLLLVYLGTKEFSVQLERRRLSICGGALLFISIVFFLIRNSDGTFFSLGALLTGTVVALVLFFGRFFDGREAALIRDLAGKLYTKPI